MRIRVAALLVDLDNTLFDRDHAVRHWAADFAHTRLALSNGEPGVKVDAVEYTLALDAQGYGSKTETFAAHE